MILGIVIISIIIVLIWILVENNIRKNDENYERETELPCPENQPEHNQNIYYSANPTQNYRPQPNNQNYQQQGNYQNYQYNPINTVNPVPGTQTTSKQKNSYLPYHKKSLLTQREYIFYKRLKLIADKYNLQVLAKIRFADLVEVNSNVNPKYKQTWFYKIQAKHIDFAIADEMKIITLLELDDSTHSQADRIERDEFVDSVVKKCGYTIIHTYGELETIENEMRKYRKSTFNAIS